ncbi:hypothetical protein WN982_19170 [Paraburkholderia sp. IMGN_8]|uniref:hypothetical protein n=1 Tax=Paraburkholderia sp. IMGN_8 TaxID=3136564 RepID=UPI0031011A91
MSERKTYGGRARLNRNLSGHEVLRTDLNPELANQITAFRVGMTPDEVAIGYRFALAMSNPAVDLVEDAEKIRATAAADEVSVEGKDDQHRRAA